MRVVVVDRGPNAVLALSGELDEFALEPLAAAVLALVGPAASVLVDLAGVHFIDGAGLAGLLNAQVIAVRHGCTLRVARPQPYVLRLLEIVGLDALLLA
jgi:anti-anti-sigma factor